ncbi:UNVERIFIED_CONTAM: hypothetical protein K2H54_058021 [Gekko kuhli]
MPWDDIETKEHGYPQDLGYPPHLPALYPPRYPPRQLQPEQPERDQFWNGPPPGQDPLCWHLWMHLKENGADMNRFNQQPDFMLHQALADYERQENHLVAAVRTSQCQDISSTIAMMSA